MARPLRIEFSGALYHISHEGTLVKISTRMNRARTIVLNPSEPEWFAKKKIGIRVVTEAQPVILNPMTV